MVAWEDIDTVMLDMDGTLLDLHFDNFFWHDYLPRKWGERNDLDHEAARDELLPLFANTRGTLSWYSIDYWSERLDIDVMDLKQDIEHLIRYRPDAEMFLAHLRKIGKQVVLVTNAHQKLLHMKIRRTGVDRFFDRIISSHDLGVPKEDIEFWRRLRAELEFQPEKTVLIDDNLTVLRTARSFGIAQLLSIARPDSSAGERDTGEFWGVNSFRELMS